MQVEIHSYEDIGQYLREVRETLGVDTREVAQRLNIRAKYLEALEAGDMDALPAKIYARGYLQNYAEFLGLDKREIAEAFDRLGGGERKMRYFVPEPTERNYQPGLVVVAVALVVVLAVYYGWYDDQHNARATTRVAPVPERLILMGEDVMVMENDGNYVLPDGEITYDSISQDEIAGEEMPEAAASQASSLRNKTEKVQETLPWLKEE